MNLSEREAQSDNVETEWHFNHAKNDNSVLINNALK